MVARFGRRNFEKDPYIDIGGIESDPVLRPSPFRVPLLQPRMVWRHGQSNSGIFLMNPEKDNAIHRVSMGACDHEGLLTGPPFACY